MYLTASIEKKVQRSASESRHLLFDLLLQPIRQVLRLHIRTVALLIAETAEPDEDDKYDEPENEQSLERRASVAEFTPASLTSLERLQELAGAELVVH